MFANRMAGERLGVSNLKHDAKVAREAISPGSSQPMRPSERKPSPAPMQSAFIDANTKPLARGH